MRCGRVRGNGTPGSVLLLVLQLAVLGSELTLAVAAEPDRQAGGPGPGDEEGAEHDVTELERVAVRADEPHHQRHDKASTDPQVPPP